MPPGLYQREAGKGFLDVGADPIFRPLSSRYFTFPALVSPQLVARVYEGEWISRSDNIPRYPCGGWCLTWCISCLGISTLEYTKLITKLHGVSFVAVKTCSCAMEESHSPPHLLNWPLLHHSHTRVNAGVAFLEKGSMVKSCLGISLKLDVCHDTSSACFLFYFPRRRSHALVRPCARLLRHRWPVHFESPLTFIYIGNSIIWMLEGLDLVCPGE